jgi:hypothetical protein
MVIVSDDSDRVPVTSATCFLLAEAAGPSAELRILPGAGHRLRAEPSGRRPARRLVGATRP